MCEPRRTRRQRPVAAQSGGGRDRYHPYPTIPAIQDTDEPKVTQAETASIAGIDSTSTTPQPCRLLELPAELRNEIYELAFTRATPGEGPIELLTANPPSSALLQTCRQIYNEAKQLFSEGVRQYYSNEHFVFDVHGRLNSRSELREVARRFDLQNMRNLRVTFGIRFSTVYAIEPQPDRKSFVVKRVSTTHYQERHCGFRVCTRADDEDEGALLFVAKTEEERDVRLAHLESWPRHSIVLRVADQVDIMLATHIGS